MNYTASLYRLNFAIWPQQGQQSIRHWSSASLPFWTRRLPYHLVYSIWVPILQIPFCLCFLHRTPWDRIVADAQCFGSLVNNNAFLQPFCLFVPSFWWVVHTQSATQASSWPPPHLVYKCSIATFKCCLKRGRTASNDPSWSMAWFGKTAGHSQRTVFSFLSFLPRYLLLPAQQFSWL